MIPANRIRDALRAQEATGRRAGAIHPQQRQNRHRAILTNKLHEVLSPVIDVRGGDDALEVLHAEEDDDQRGDAEQPRGERADPHALRDDGAGLEGLLSEMGGCVVPVEDPCAEEDGDEPAVAVGCLFRFAEIDSVVEEVEDSRAGVEVAVACCGGDREPHPVHGEEAEEDHDREAEVILQQARVPDVGDDGEEHPDGGQQPEEPAFGQDGGVRVFDLQGGDKEVRGALLDARDDGDPAGPVPPGGHPGEEGAIFRAAEAVGPVLWEGMSEGLF